MITNESSDRTETKVRDTYRTRDVDVQLSTLAERTGMNRTFTVTAKIFGRDVGIEQMYVWGNGADGTVPVRFFLSETGGNHVQIRTELAPDT